jgi:hypothetical protein
MRLLFVIESNVRCGRRWFCLTLIAAAQLAAPIRPLNF